MQRFFLLFAVGENPFRLEFPQVNLSENRGKLLKFPLSAEIDERDGGGEHR
jgi:hypothetical protein